MSWKKRFTKEFDEEPTQDMIHEYGTYYADSVRKVEVAKKKDALYWVAGTIAVGTTVTLLNGSDGVNVGLNYLVPGTIQGLIYARVRMARQDNLESLRVNAQKTGNDILRVLSQDTPEKAYVELEAVVTERTGLTPEQFISQEEHYDNNLG